MDNSNLEVFSCNMCEKHGLDEEIHVMNEEMWVCDECMDKHEWYKCNFCGEKYLEKDMINNSYNKGRCMYCKDCD